MPATFDPTYDTELDAGRESVTLPDRFATDAQIGQAVEQLDAGQPVTALPRQDWSYQQAAAFNAKLDAFDQQARAARAASEQAARDAELLDRMSRTAKSVKDIEVMLQQQDVIGFQRWIAGRGNPVEGLTRFPRAATSPLVAAVRASQPETMAPAPTEVTLPSGQTGVRSGRYGERFSFPPQPRIEAPGNLPEDVTNAIATLRTERNELDRNIADLSYLTTPETKAKVAAFQKRRDAVDRRLRELNPKVEVSGGSPEGATGTIHPLPTSKSALVAGQIYDTPRGAARWDGTNFKLVETR